MITLVVRHRFIFRSVLLSSIAKPFLGMKESLRFFNLVQEYLPEAKARLLAMEPNDAARRFVGEFSKKYFPIEQPCEMHSWDLNRDLMKEVSRIIDIEWHGLASGCYDSGQLSKAQILASSVCENPFGEANDRYIGFTESRIPIVDRLEKYSHGVVKLLPKKGWKLTLIEDALEDGKYPGLLDWCRWLFHRTGLAWFDDGGRRLLWAPETVADLTRDYPLYEAADRRMKDFNKWLATGFPEKAVEVVKYIKMKIGKPLIEVLKDSLEVSNGEEN